MRVRYERAINPQQTDQISFDHADKNNHLGDPVHFNAYLMWQLTRSDFKDTDTSSITDWNMDADRGYAYHCWDWNRHSAPAEGEPLDAAHWVLEDLEGHKYLEPCTPPPQAPKKSDGCCPARRMNQIRTNHWDCTILLKKIPVAMWKWFVREIKRAVNIRGSSDDKP